jgi:hypothetical protein
MSRVIASYANLLGKCEVNRKSAVKSPQVVRLVKNGQVHSQRCVGCSGLEYKNKRIQPRMTRSFQHKKGCKYA